jgi:hypothetical protein
MQSLQSWQAEVERRAAEVEAQKVRLRLAVLVLSDTLKNAPPRAADRGRLEVR